MPEISANLPISVGKEKEWLQEQRQERAQHRLQYFKDAGFEEAMKQEIMQALHHLRISDSGRWLECKPYTQHNVTTYTIIVSTMLEVSAHLPWNVPPMEMDRMGVAGSTKYLGKKYLDRFLTVNPSLEEKYFILVAITCIRTAVKFNQSADFSSSYCIQNCLIQSGHQYQVQEFVECEASLCSALQFKFHISTPYDYLLVCELLREEHQLFPLLDTLIIFLLTIPELFQDSSEELFFGVLLYIRNSRKSSLFNASVIKSITRKWDQAQRIAELITLRLNQMQL